MRRLIVALLACLGGLFILLIVLTGGFGYWAVHRLGAPAEARLPARIVLTLDLREALAEAAGFSPFDVLGDGPSLTVSEAVLALDRAARDPRVAGLVVRLDGEGQGWAVAQELREAVLAFRASGNGRFADAWSDSLGELSPGNEGYMLAAAFDRITIQPGGYVGLAGLGIEQPFARGLLDRLGIEPEVARRGRYKTALDNVTEKGLTPANAEMLNDVADSLFGQLVAAVAEGRGLPPERVRALIDGGPYLAEDALDGGLIDGLAYEDEALHFALAKADLGGEPGSGHDTRAVGLDRYAGAVGTGADDDGSAPRVALVRAAGAVTRGSALPGEAIAADDTAELLLSLRKDPDVRAVVLRLDTPGGSAVASETVGREVRELVASGRPVVVSMGNAAASGGYWISMGASRIVAQPGTLTGSIGVFAAKPVVGEALSKLDVNVAEIDRGEHADLWSLAKGYDPADRAKVEGIVGGLYDRFKAGVAKGRGLDPAEVERIAQGRVWTGERALGLRLVDRLGGLGEAFAETRTLLDLPADAPLDVRLYPEPKNPVEAVVAWFEGGGGLLGFAARIETALGAALDGGLLARSPVLRVR